MLETILLTLLWMTAASVIGISVVIMLTMSPSSASRGGRVYVAVIAIVLLGAVSTQLWRRSRPGSSFGVTTAPEERRFDPRGIPLFILASVLLLGFALYLTVGMSSVLVRFAAYALLVAATPFLFTFLMRRFVKKPFDAIFDLLFPDEDTTRAPRTFTFSLGSPPPGSVDPDSARTAPAAPTMTDGRVRHYRSAWSCSIPPRDSSSPI